MSDDVKVEEPTFEEVINALQVLDARIARLEGAFDKHEHKASGEVVLRVG